ncbi:hypothetical protein [Paenibacillus sp. N3.4]|uniref:hypothetical protein n=1 Tax=Paenibacillus sp. N3.4 TaxID=2603222 RepID=UPI0011C97437|nr:hypothetical protein [Paenibacillus sp. N3.4]TXK78362.1 hypothetical protein FU659_20340 [Paenibacillus sp. N3.4]
MMHKKMIVEEKEILMFFESIYQDRVQAAVDTIIKHLPNLQIRKIFDELGLVNVTNTEVVLYSLDGDIETLCIG